MTLRVLINGASGRMGQLTASTLSADPDFVIVGKPRRTESLKASILETKPDIVIDFTRADMAYSNLITILENGARPIIGTSGLSANEVADAKERFPRRGGIIVPNFSLGAVLLMKYAAEIARWFPDTEIIEMHHHGKLDSPSGTAIRTAELLAAHRDTAHRHTNAPHEIIKGARGAEHQGIPIHAVRLPGLVAHLQVLFGGQGETLTLRHDSTDRQCFMPGVLLACRNVMHLDQLVYGLEHLLDQHTAASLPVE